MRRRLPASFYNATTLVGAGLSLITLGLIAFLFIVELYSEQHHPYMGLVTFIFLPAFIFLGLFIMLVGIIRARAKAKHGAEAQPLPSLDLNNRRHRNAVAGALFCGVLFLAATAFGSYQAYEYTDSVEFCGLVCHDVMKPEYVAYRESPHARVSCVQCHIGPGATWYVRSKMSGAYQVYSTIANKYHRPIATPIENLRPARETCEQCHWPKHFYSHKLRENTYHVADEKNTRTTISLLMKIGGGSVEHGASEGIHSSMYLNNEISYIATDRRRLVIPYVESKDRNGKVTVYKSTETPITADQIAKLPKRVVDCVDCHNRPSHRYNHPARVVNQAMAAGLIDTSLPEIKRLAVEILEKPYKTEPEALAAIRSAAEVFYKKNHPLIYEQDREKVAKAIERIQYIFSHNYFPEMKVNWKSYPDFLDHTYSQGCFRCHDGKHVSDTGKTISNDCQTCHTILSQKGAGGKEEVSKSGLEFKHPVDIGDAWKTMKCVDCHVTAE